MPSANRALELYQELAEHYDQRGQAQMRDRFLVLAADAALAAGNPEEAERLRHRLLQQNPHHLIKPYPSLEEALKAPDVKNYVGDLRRSYSPEAAEHLLQTLRISATPPAAPSPSPPKPPSEPRGPEPAKQTPEVLKFYRLEGEVEDVVPEPVAQRQIPATRPVPKPAAPPPPRPAMPEVPPTQRAPARKPPRPAEVSPFALEPPPPARPGANEHEARDLATGFWVSSGLFVLLLVASLALAVYTFARPFLPAEWFR